MSEDDVVQLGNDLSMKPVQQLDPEQLEESPILEEESESSGDLDLEEKVAERVRVPMVRSNAPGKVNRTLETLGEVYKSNHPDRDCRWVYSPEHRRELSNTISRSAEGYVKVRVAELGVELEDLGSDDVVRIGDVILMSITKGEKKELVDEKQELADEAIRAVEREYYEASEEMFDGVKTHSDESSGAPRGRTKTEIRTHEVEIDQRTE